MVEYLDMVFPYPSFRPHQREVIRFVYEVIRDGRIGLLNSPCGTGKSVAVLSAFFSAWSEALVDRLVVVVRTKSQLEIYGRELRRIFERGVDFSAAMFKSRMEMCPLIREEGRLREIGYREFLQYCRDMVRGTYGYTCPYYRKTYSGRSPSSRTIRLISRMSEEGVFHPDEVMGVCVDEGVCPYEVMKHKAKYADVFVGNYNYVLVKPIRTAVFEKNGIPLTRINCVFDEAHNLPDYITSTLSDELTTISMERALREGERYGVERLSVIEGILKACQSITEEVYRERGLDEERLIDLGEFSKRVLKETRMPNMETLLVEISRMKDRGEKIARVKGAKGETPRSYVRRFAEFFKEWFECERAIYVRYVTADMTRDGRVFGRFGMACMDVSMAAEPINALRSAVLMSGTLWHTDYYIDVLGLDRSRVECMSVEDPFRDNRLILVDRVVSTRYEERGDEGYRLLAEHLKWIVEDIDGRIAVYFPSYEVMREVLARMKAPWKGLVEDRDTRIEDVIEFLSSSEEAVLFGVARGKVSEGVDMTVGGRSLLSAVVVAGLPYAKKSELRDEYIKFYERRFGKDGYRYAVEIPCAVSIAQLAGRLCRSPEDRGLIFILDRRVLGGFRRNLPKDWIEDMRAYSTRDEMRELIGGFLDSSAHNPNL